MKSYLLFTVLLCNTLLAQIRTAPTTTAPATVKKEQVKPSREDLRAIYKRRALEAPKWKKYNSFGVHLNEVSFSNWKAGGVSAFSVMTDAKLVRRYIATNYFWDNELLFNYGLTIQHKERFKKMDDKLLLTSTFGYRTSELQNWYYSAKLSFNTQLTNGYNYPNRDDAVSKLFSPAYLYAGVGAEYANEQVGLRVFASPLTLKSTIVLSETLANKGAFGVSPAQYNSQNELVRKGRKSLTELGLLITAQWERSLWENIKMEQRLTLYTDYLNHFGNIDIDWEGHLALRVNEHVKARLGFHLIYDDDVKFFERTTPWGQTEAYGARLQFKQLLSVGFQYSF